jgi:hypothetical protein
MFQEASMHYRVTVAYTAQYTDPIAFHNGDELVVTDRRDNWKGWTWVWCINQHGKEGWVPDDMIRIDGMRGIALADYSAVELTAGVSDILTALNETHGWLWARNKEGQIGWIPRENVEPI